MIEIVDGVLQFLEHIFLALALARDVGERPHGHAVAAALAERADAEPQPPRRPALGGGDAHLLLQPLAFPRRLEEAIDRFGGVGIADENALDRPQVLGIDGVDQIEIGGIGVDDPAVGVGDDEAVECLVDHGLEERIGALGRRQPQDAGGKREQREHAHSGEHRQEAEDIGLGIAASEHDKGGGGGDQDDGDQEHQDDAAGASATGRAVDRLAGAGSGFLGDAVCGHLHILLPREAGKGDRAASAAWWKGRGLRA